MRDPLGRLARLVLFLGLLGVACAGWTQGPVPARPEAPSGAQGKGAVTEAQRYFTDLELVNQDGETMRLYTDLLKGKVVVINTIFTTCTGICPVMSRAFTRLQDHLGDRLGRDVHLISISVDPKHDTPERLKAFGQNFGVRHGWYLLTGKKANVESALHKLGQAVEFKEDHKALVLVGNEPTGLWKKAFGLAPPEDLIAIVDSVLRDDAEPAVSASHGG